MMMETIALRISECVDDLGLLLDQIYKFPQKQRENYFEKIQSLKNKLLSLKTNLRQTNASNTEKQYKQIYLNTNTLKNEITQNLSLITVSKENKDHRRQFKETRKNHDDAMRLLVEKDQEIAKLAYALKEKEVFLGHSQGELMLIRNDFERLDADNKRLKYDNNSLQIQSAKTKTELRKADDQIQQLLALQQQNRQVMSRDREELEQLRTRFSEASSRLFHFQQLAEISIKKTRIVEENIRKVQRQAQDLNDNFKVKESDNLRKLRQIQELEYEVEVSSYRISEVESQNKRFKEDIVVLQKQLTELQRKLFQQINSFNQQRKQYKEEYQQLQVQIHSAQNHAFEITSSLEKTQEKYSTVIAKLNSAEQSKIQFKESQYRNQILQDVIRKMEKNAQEYQQQLHLSIKDYERINYQLKKALTMNKDMEVELFKQKEKTRLKEDEKLKLNQQIESYHRKIRQLESKNLAKHEDEQTIRKQNTELMTKMAKLQEKQRHKDKEVGHLKIKLLRAKIQAVHEIREVIV